MTEQKTITIDLRNEMATVSVNGMTPLNIDSEVLDTKLTEFFNSGVKGEAYQILILGSCAQDDLQNVANQFAKNLNARAVGIRTIGSEPPYPGAKPN